MSRSGRAGGHRVVLTGGPGGGKTTAADLFRREIGQGLVVVPEVATVLFTGGFPRVDEPHARRAAQQAIYHVQRNMEDIQAARYPERVLLCDRGTVDGAVYWPEDGDFFVAVGSSLEAELARYDAVIFFESAALGGIDIEGGNPARIESRQEAAALDRRLRGYWSRHPRYHFVAHEPSFLAKIGAGLKALRTVLRDLDGD